MLLAEPIYNFFNCPCPKVIWSGWGYWKNLYFCGLQNNLAYHIHIKMSSVIVTAVYIKKK